MSPIRSLVVLLCVAAVVALILVSDRNGVAARRGDLQRAEYTRIAKLAAVGVVVRMESFGASPRFGAEPVPTDANTGQPLTADQVAQRLAAAKS